MKWSWKIGTLAGIVIQVHATFAILIVWLAVRAWREEPSLWAVTAGLAFVIALFGSIVLHELGHALTARHFGIRTRDITLLPIGGVARLERMPEEPMQEWLVAVAGPAVNAVLASILFAGLWLAGAPPSDFTTGLVEASFVERLMWVNVVLLVFNLIPAFPMDGGRALRAVLATRLSYVRATRVAAGLGQAIALVFGGIGLLENPFLIFIALFVWIGAAAEVSMVRTRSALEGLPVSEAMLTDFAILEPNDPLSRAVDLTLAGSQKDFPVVEGDSLSGVVTQEDLVRGLSRAGSGSNVRGVMRSPPAAVDLSAPLYRALERFDAASRLLPVTDAGRLVGILTADNIFELLRFRAALEAPRLAGRSRPQEPEANRALRWASRG